MQDIILETTKKIADKRIAENSAQLINGVVSAYTSGDTVYIKLDGETNPQPIRKLASYTAPVANDFVHIIKSSKNNYLCLGK